MTTSSANITEPSNSQLVPRCPPEIELEIFLQAYHDGTRDERVRMLRVAKRVSTWLSPLLYRAVIVRDENIYPPMETLRRYGSHVRHIYLSSATADLFEGILSACPDVENLSYWFTPYVPIPDIFATAIRRLSLYRIGSLEKQLKDALKGADSIRTEAWCSRLTHLSLGKVDDTPPEILGLFPNLTHLLIGAWNEESVIAKVLPHCPRLEVFVWLLGSYSDEEKTLIVDNRDYFPSTDDDRVVTVDTYLVLDWIRGTEGHEDIWAIADKEVRRRVQNRRLGISSRMDI